MSVESLILVLLKISRHFVDIEGLRKKRTPSQSTLDDRKERSKLTENKVGSSNITGLYFSTVATYIKEGRWGERERVGGESYRERW